MAVEIGKERDLTKTSTWAVAVVCLVLVFISLLLEHALHALGKRLHKLNKPALVEALEKIKSELMLMGFISLLLTVGQGPITDICVSPSVASTWLPCKSKATSDDSKDDRRRRLLEYFVSGEFDRRVLAEKPTDHCSEKGKVAFVSAYGIHQLHYFIFVLAIFHIFYCIITYILGRTKMRRWKAWENETKTIEYQYHNDPERFRFARDTSFGKRHLKLWSRSPILLWIVCFFRQFYGSVTKVDYLTLRHGFITAHLAPGSGTKFDFRKYIERSLEDDFKEVVGINGVMWFIGVLFLLSNTHGWNAYLWLPFIPLVIILLVGAKLQVIITQMGLRIQERGDVVRGAPLVQPSDELFWFGSPRLILFLIHLVLFQNAFQLAFFFWSWWKFGIKSCFHDHDADVIIRITMGVIIQFLCSYVTLPLYALVTQMGTTMRPTVFNDKLQTALKKWHHTAKKQSKHGKHSESSSHTPMSSMPGTPSRGMSPVHLLHNHRSSTAPNSAPVSPRNSNFDNDQWDPEAPNGMHYHYLEVGESVQSQRVGSQEINAAEPEDTSSAPLGPDPIGSQHEIDIGLADFTFRK